MAPPPIAQKKAKAFVESVERLLGAGFLPPNSGQARGKKTALAAACDAHDIPQNSARGHLEAAERSLGRKVNWKLYVPASATALQDRILAMLKRAAMPLETIAATMGMTPGKTLDLLNDMRARGYTIHKFGERFSLEKAPAPSHTREIPEYVSRPDGTFLFGFTSDNHLGSKYSRLDVLNSLYDEFAAQKVDRVFNAGNWIDGEARFNKHDLLVHGFENQLRYLAEHYPQRKGIVTHAVAGDDHEGWTAQREGLDPGRAAERMMRDAGRTDWVDHGYMEAFIRLKNAKTGKSTMLHLMHPGGGSAYATSYTVQKIVEGYDGGEKPAVLLAGHYHKLSYNLVRNVHAIQTGTTQDQTPFMRKKKISAHVGGGICQLRQDPDTGAIIACRTEFLNFFVRDYYNGRWSHSGNVALPERGHAK